MLDTILKHNSFLPKHLFIVEIDYSGFDAYTVHLSEIKLVKNEPILIACEKDISDIEKRIGELPEKSNLVILIHGSQVFQQILTGDDDESLEERFMWGDPSDFYIQKDFGDYAWISFVRKEITDFWISKLQQNKARIVQLNIGTLHLRNYLTAIQLPEGSHQIANYTLQWTGSEFQAITKANSTLVDTSDNNEIALASAVQYFFQIPSPENHIPIQKIDDYDMEARSGKFNLSLAKMVLPIVLIALLGNFFYQGELEKEYHNLESQLNQKKQLFKKRELLQKSLDEKGAFINGDDQNAHLSYYADQIAHYKPAQIKFKSIHLNPIKSLKKSNIVFEQNRILVKGVAYNNNQFQSWIGLLKKCDWLKSIDISQFKQSATKKEAHFELNIYIRKS